MRLGGALIWESCVNVKSGTLHGALNAWGGTADAHAGLKFNKRKNRRLSVTERMLTWPLPWCGTRPPDR